MLTIALWFLFATVYNITQNIQIIKKCVWEPVHIGYPSNHPASTKINPLRRKTSAEGILFILPIPRHNRLIRSQQPEKIVLNIQPVSAGSNSQRIYQGACSRTILCVGEQPVLSSYNKRSDCIFSSVVVYWNIRQSKKSVKILRSFANSFLFFSPTYFRQYRTNHWKSGRKMV